MSATVFGKKVPGTRETVYLQYDFEAKLGINGSQIEVTPAGPKTYRISFPAFTFIGYDEPTFQVAVEDGSALSWVTPDIDTVEMVNEILDGDARQKYIESNTQVLQGQAKTFYERLLASVDPEITATFEFQTR